MTAAPKRDHDTHGSLPVFCNSGKKPCIGDIVPQVTNAAWRTPQNTFRSINRSAAFLPRGIERAPGSAWPPFTEPGELSVPRLAGRVRCVDRSDHGTEGDA